jgi:hypothetical protein
MLLIRPSTVGRHLRRAVACLALVAFTTGCASWQATDLTPQQAFANGSRPPKVRVTTADGTRTVIERPRVLGGVLAGYEEQCARDFGLGSGQCEETGIAIFEIAVLEMYERGPALIILPGVAALALTAVLISR